MERPGRGCLWQYWDWQFCPAGYRDILDDCEMRAGDPEMDSCVKVLYRWATEVTKEADSTSHPLDVINELRHVERWNRDVPVGSRVKWWPRFDECGHQDGEPVDCRTRSLARYDAGDGGAVVDTTHEKLGTVALKNLEVP